jgi:protein-tyrosine-phosphatase
MVERKRRVLFVCIGNCCRSPLAEALLRHRGGDRFEAHSAGTRPVGIVHPVVFQVLAERGVSADGLCTQGCAEYAGQEFDAVITLCECAAAPSALELAGQPAVAHWPTRDPYALQWRPPEMVALAREVAAELDRRIEALLALDWGVLSPLELQCQLAQLGTC